MKKLITLFLALTMALCFPLAALAENNLDLDGETMTVTQNGEYDYIFISYGGELTVDSNVELKAGCMGISGPFGDGICSKLIIREGASVKVSNIFTCYGEFTLDIAGTFEGGNGFAGPAPESKIILRSGAVAKLGSGLESLVDGYCVAHDHDYVIARGSHDYQDGKCVNCGASAPSASTLSQGSATVVCTIAAFVLGFAAATVIFTRKKTKG